MLVFHFLSQSIGWEYAEVFNWILSILSETLEAFQVVAMKLDIDVISAILPHVKYIEIGQLDADGMIVNQISSNQMYSELIVITVNDEWFDACLKIVENVYYQVRSAKEIVGIDEKFALTFGIASDFAGDCDEIIGAFINNCANFMNSSLIHTEFRVNVRRPNNKRAIGVEISSPDALKMIASLPNVDRNRLSFDYTVIILKGFLSRAVAMPIVDFSQLKSKKSIKILRLENELDLINRFFGYLARHDSNESWQNSFEGVEAISGWIDSDLEYADIVFPILAQWKNLKFVHLQGNNPLIITATDFHEADAMECCQEIKLVNGGASNALCIRRNAVAPAA